VGAGADLGGEGHGLAQGGRHAAVRVDGYVARLTKVEVQWQRQGARPNDGGISTAAFARTSMVKIPR
jgi:hypothetical protein